MKDLHFIAIPTAIMTMVNPFVAAVMVVTFAMGFPFAKRA